MKRNEFHTIDSAYLNILNESRQRWLLYNLKVITRNNPTIVQIKEALLKLSNMINWNDFVISQKVGECSFIAQSVSRMFPKIEMYSVVINFSEQAISKMEPQDDPDMYTCTHYLNKFKNTWIDFGKGTNRYEGIYVLDGIDDMYSCLYSKEAVERLIDPIKQDPKMLGTVLR